MNYKTILTYYPAKSPHSGYFHFVKGHIFLNFLRKIFDNKIRCFIKNNKYINSDTIIDNNTINNVNIIENKEKNHSTKKDILYNVVDNDVKCSNNIISFKYKKDIEYFKYKYPLENLHKIYTYHISPIYLIDKNNYKIINESSNYNILYHERKYDGRLLKTKGIEYNNNKNTYRDITYCGVDSIEKWLDQFLNCKCVITDNFDIWYLASVFNKSCYFHNKENNIDYKNMLDIFGTDDVNSNQFHEKLEYEKDRLSKYIKNLYPREEFLKENYQPIYIEDKKDFFLNIDSIKEKIIEYPYYCAPSFILKRTNEQKILDNITILSVVFGQNQNFIKATIDALTENIKNLEYLPKEWIILECQDKEEDFQLDKINQLHNCIKYIKVKYRTDFFIKAFLFKYALKNYVQTKKIIYVDCDVIFCNPDAIYNIDINLNNKPFCYLSNLYNRSSQHFNDNHSYLVSFKIETGYGFCQNMEYDCFLDGESFPISYFYPSSDSASINDMLLSYNISINTFISKRATTVPNFILKNKGLINFFNNKQSEKIIAPYNIVSHVRHSCHPIYSYMFVLQEFFRYTKIKELFPNFNGNNLPDVNPWYIDCFKSAKEIIKKYNSIFHFEKTTSYIDYKLIDSYKQISQKYYGQHHNNQLNIVLLIDNLYYNNINKKSDESLDDAIDRIYKDYKNKINSEFNFYVLTDKDTEYNRLKIDGKLFKLFNILEIFKYKFPDSQDVLIVTPRILPNLINIKTFRCKNNMINIRRLWNFEQKKYEYSDNILYYNGDHSDIYKNYIEELKNNNMDFYTKYDSPINYIVSYYIKNNMDIGYIDRYFRISQDKDKTCEFLEI